MEQIKNKQEVAMTMFDIPACLRWTQVDAREAMGDLKLIVSAQDFHGLFAGETIDVLSGFWRGIDTLGNSIMVRVVPA